MLGTVAIWWVRTASSVAAETVGSGNAHAAPRAAPMGSGPLCNVDVVMLCDTGRRIQSRPLVRPRFRDVARR